MCRGGRQRDLQRYTEVVSSPLPPHLQHLVVQQDYEAYGEIAHAVWRFVMLNTHSRLQHSAHPAYQRGLRAAGVDLQRIPRIEHMNECLQQFGWSAVCVDGFIPPRAFVEFQALGILPIAADMRTLEHLPYTPAPDIIHEAGGHAPFLCEPEYAAFLRAIAEVGQGAFTLPQDGQVYTAIHALSEIKEDPTATLQQVQHAEERLQQAWDECRHTSDAAKLARLYWWTIEYGLVGRPDDYSIYGAGLLSSLGESHGCHGPEVIKRTLDADCIEVAYDITRPQPHLFVARDFNQLHEVLAQVQRGLAHLRGGLVSVQAAIDSGETCSVEFDSGAHITGTLQQCETRQGEATFLSFAGACAIHLPASATPGAPHVLWSQDYGCPVLQLHPAEAARVAQCEPGSHISVSDVNSVNIAGLLVERFDAVGGTPAVLTLQQARIVRPEHAPWYPALLYPVVCGRVLGARASNPDAASAAPPTQRPSLVPRHGRTLHSAQPLEALYQRVRHGVQQLSPGEMATGEMEQCFTQVYSALQRDFPDEWLLRWNLLEHLLRVDALPGLRRTLQSELEALEIRLQYVQPIATGLAYLAREPGLTRK